VTFAGGNDLLCLLNHRKMGKMSPTQADIVCLVVLRQFIFRGMEVNWTLVRDGYNARFNPEPEVTLVDIFWNYCQWFQDLSGFGPGVERSISVGEWGRVLRIVAVVESGEDFEMSDLDAPKIHHSDISENEDTPTGGSQVPSREEYNTVADDTALLELTNETPPKNSREDDQMLVDEFAIVNGRYSKSRSPEPFLGDESENNVSVIDDSSVFDEYARNRQIALDNAATMNPNSVVFEEDPNPVVDDTIPVEPAPPELPKEDDQKPVNQPRPAKSKYSRSRAIWRQVRLSRTP
jgi:hypothetical protein